MKKIFSLILAIALVASFSTIAFAKDIVFTLRTAADYEGLADKAEFNTGDVIYLMIDTNGGLKGISALFSLEDSVFEIAQYEGADDVSGGSYTGAAVMNPSGMEDALSFTAATTASRPGTLTGGYIGLQVKEDAPSGEYAIFVSGVFNQSVMGEGNTCSSNSVTVKINGVDPQPDVKTVAVADSKIVTTDASATDCQIGSGLGLSVNAGEAVFTKMIWALTSGSDKLFSKAIEFDVPVSGDFKVAATFINGAHNEKFDVEPVEPVAIDAVNAIFTDGTDDYFTDEADAAFKAE